MIRNFFFEIEFVKFLDSLGQNLGSKKSDKKWAMKLKSQISLKQKKKIKRVIPGKTL